jgi:hypothetical protein
VIEDGGVKRAEFFGREEGEEEGKEISGEGVEEQKILVTQRHLKYHTSLRRLSETVSEEQQFGM